ncbi:hypothetical protein CSA56_07770 [candidate division KSB3 bacterium]|uniref:Lipocalin-like domain-containing protein n=1 Tax=candidate division KSB3 bacterium TaxID=2044937 RepID=A0A2G6KF57_9BACT|nr:MAG: hypothetical protein CSA56_07770 [candidate division KSB3 bacterium]
MNLYKVLPVFACLLLLIVSCGGGGSSSPTSASGPINVAGVWSFTGQLTNNACNLDAVSPISGDIDLTQSGAIVTTGRVDLSVERGSSWFFHYAGTVTGNNVSLSARDPYVFRRDGRVTHFGSGIDIQNIQNGTGTGSLNVTGQCIQGCTGSCQTIWSGSWTKQ